MFGKNAKMGWIIAHYAHVSGDSDGDGTLMISMDVYLVGTDGGEMDVRRYTCSCCAYIFQVVQLVHTDTDTAVHCRYESVCCRCILGPWTLDLST